jgi:hypothetical protein
MLKKVPIVDMAYDLVPIAKNIELQVHSQIHASLQKRMLYGERFFYVVAEAGFLRDLQDFVKRLARIFHAVVFYEEQIDVFEFGSAVFYDLVFGSFDVDL